MVKPERSFLITLPFDAWLWTNQSIEVVSLSNSTVFHAEGSDALHPPLVRQLPQRYGHGGRFGAKQALLGDIYVSCNILFACLIY